MTGENKFSDSTDDILQPLPYEKWPLLKETLKRDWPQFACHYYWIHNAIEWRKKDPNIKQVIYCPEGKHDIGVYVGISSYSICSVHLFTFNETKSILFDCVTKTKRIDWSQAIVLAAVHGNYLDTVKEIIGYLGKTINLEIDNYGPTNMYYKSKEDCLAVETNVPDGFEIKPLDDTNVELIHEVWPHVEIKQDPVKSTKFISTIIQLNGGIGLFDKKNGNLVCWVLKSEWAGLTMVQTVEEYKRRGFAKLIVSEYSKMLAKEGLDVTLFIVVGNIKSENMFISLNYKRVNTIEFILTKAIKKR